MGQKKKKTDALSEVLEKNLRQVVSYVEFRLLRGEGGVKGGASWNIRCNHEV